MGKSKFDAIKDTLKTGDIVLFEVDKTIPRKIIQFFTKSKKWAHLGMVYIRGEEKNRQVLLYESDMLVYAHLKDLDTGKVRHGVRLTDLRERVRVDKANIAVRRLNRPLTADMLQKLESARAEFKGRLYELNPMELLNAAIDSPGHENKEDLRMIFCSELVAKCYQRMGLLPDGTGAKPSNEYTPKDFGTEETLQLLYGYELGDEELIAF